jgi:hypothetical protein
LLAKHLSHYGITFGQIHIRMVEKFSEVTECHNKVPLYLLPSSDQKSQHFLREVNNTLISSILQHFERQLPSLLSYVSIYNKCSSMHTNVIDCSYNFYLFV